MATSNHLKELIAHMTREQVKSSTLQPENKFIIKSRRDKQKPPYHFLISDLSTRANTILLANPIILTPETSAFILSYNPPLLFFLCTLESFMLSIQNKEAIAEAEEMVTTITRKALSKDKALVALVKGRLTKDPTSQYNLDPAIDIIMALKVRLVREEEVVDHATLYRPRKLI